MEKKWWKEGVVYQIYPRSFKDSNGDGIGDLQGIIEKLDYLKALGIDIIWLSPIYKSPNDDNGYDISDYYDIMEDFGTLDDFKQLLNEIHTRDMKLVMDQVVNHTSDEHPWFEESKASKNNQYRDYYIWRGPKEGKEPNNWASVFLGSAWEYEQNTQEYYLHLFSRKQPDLNWENPKVRKEIYDMMKWWLDLGVDGFRLDVINLISKDTDYPCVGDPELSCQWGGEFFINGPRIHEFLNEMNEEVFNHYDMMTVGETADMTLDIVLDFIGKDSKKLDMVFNFDHFYLDMTNGNKWIPCTWKLTEFKNMITNWQKHLHGRGWNTLFLNNHDAPRMVSRYGDDEQYRIESAKMLATLLFTLEGTPYLFQGEELGMTNANFKSINEYRDVETLNAYKEQVVIGGRDEGEFLKVAQQMSRDNARTPMQWDVSKNAGFTTGEPWIDVNSNFRVVNADLEINNENSVFNYYRQLINLKKNNQVLMYGNYKPLFEDSEEMMVYIRCLNDEKVLVILNFTNKLIRFGLPRNEEIKSIEWLISNYTNQLNEHNIFDCMLQPYEARVYSIR